jgi:divalent metal cation (Fe/Co/Zn/Cd) transporter
VNDHQRALRIEIFTAGYNVLEAAASFIFGSAAASIALLGFGFDSLAESLSTFILIWRLWNHVRLDEEEIERRERRAVLFVGASFIVLGLYVGYESIAKLISNEAAKPSTPGIIIALLSVTIMPVIARRKRLLGESIGSRALIADSRETLACAWLSVALLAGLGANALFGFRQADPLAGLVIVFFLLREGWEYLRGEAEE